MKLHVYSCGPMDFGWHQVPTIAQHMSQLDALRLEDYLQDVIRFSNFVRDCLAAARDEGWEGDFRSHHEPRVIVLPSGEEGVIEALVWKQDNNGTTFVVSPVVLPWLA